jgi:hypothetical protein
VIYGEVPYYRGFLRSIAHKPKGIERFPAVFFIQDYDCGSIEFSKDTLSPIKQLIDGWVKAGYAVYRIEKPGVGESAGTKDCSRLNYNEELTAYQNAFSTLKKLPFIDSTRIFIFGHSVGGITAPLVAAKSKYKPKGIMVYGTVMKSWFEYMIDVFRKQPALYNESVLSIEANTRMMTPLLYEWLVQGKSTNDLMQNPEFEAILTSIENPLVYQKGNFFGRSAAYFSDLNRQNMAQTWVQAATPTLALHGEFDMQAIGPEAAQGIVQIINDVNPKKGTYQLVKGTDHFFSTIGSFEEGLKLQQSGKYADHAQRNFNSDLIKITTEWMQKQ